MFFKIRYCTGQAGGALCRFGTLAAFVPGSYADEFKRKNLRKAKILGEKRKIWRKGICGIALLCTGLGAFAAKTAAATGFTQEMQVQIGVFDAAEVKLDYEQAEGKYDISAESEQRTCLMPYILLPPVTAAGAGSYGVRRKTGTKVMLLPSCIRHTQSRATISAPKRYFMTRQGKRIKEFPPKTKSRIRLP